MAFVGTYQNWEIVDSAESYTAYRLGACVTAAHLDSVFTPVLLAVNLTEIVRDIRAWEKFHGI